MCGCGNETRNCQRYCNECHAEYMREWRKTHHLEGEAKHRSEVRSYFNTFVTRGKIEKDVCSKCGTDENIEAHHPDYRYPLIVKWFCRKHHIEHHEDMKKLLVTV